MQALAAVVRVIGFLGLLVGDYEALVIDRLLLEGGTTIGAPLLRRLTRSGKQYRVDLLTAMNPDFSLPNDADLVWWRDHRDQFDTTPLADCDGESCKLYLVDDARLDIATEMTPRVKELTTIPAVAVKHSSGATTIPIWPTIWPEYACRPMLLTSDPTLRFDVDPTGADGPPNTLRIRLITPDSPFSKERASYWLSLDDDYCVVESTVMQPSFESFSVGPFEKDATTSFTEYQESPSGIHFATQRIVGDTTRSTTRQITFIVSFASQE